MSIDNEAIVSTEEPTKESSIESTIKTAIVLAAGRGERLRPLTDKTPKPLLEISSRPLLEYHLEALARSGVTRVVINLSWLGDKIVSRIGGGQRFGVQVIYSDEGTVALETAGGIVKALPMLGTEPFWVVNGDVFTDFRFKPLALSPDTLAHLLLVANPAHNEKGDFVLIGDSVGNPESSDSDRAAAPYTYCGIGVFRPEFFRHCIPGSAPLAPLLREHASAGHVSGSVYAGIWDDIGSLDRLERRRALMSE